MRKYRYPMNETTMKIINELRLEVDSGASSDIVLDHIKNSISKILNKHERVFAVDESKQPYVVLFIGVNGSGKTTTIGKIAQKLTQEGKKVTLVAGDTFRAAAVEQLCVWGERTGVPVIKRQTGADKMHVGP